MSIKSWRTVPQGFLKLNWIARIYITFLIVEYFINYRIWQDIQTKVRIFLLAIDFTGFKIDDFMQILSVIYQ